MQLGSLYLFPCVLNFTLCNATEIGWLQTWTSLFQATMKPVLASSRDGIFFFTSITTRKNTNSENKKVYTWMNAQHIVKHVITTGYILSSKAPLLKKLSLLGISMAHLQSIMILVLILAIILVKCMMMKTFRNKLTLLSLLLFLFLDETKKRKKIK